MSFETIANSIRGRFKTQIADAESVSVMYDNAPFSKPNDALWIELSIEWARKEIEELGSVLTYRIPGNGLARIYNPVAEGDKDALAMADKIDVTFRGLSAGTPLVHYQTPTIVSNGNRFGAEWQTRVIFPFWVIE